MLSREDIRNIVIKINDEDIKKKLKDLETQHPKKTKVKTNFAFVFCII